MTAIHLATQRANAKIAQPFAIADVVDPALLLPELSATSKIGAIKELVDRLHGRGIVEDSLSFLQSVLEREQLQSTILGTEVALPHARSRGVRALGLALGRTATPIDFPSGDERQSVRLICLIAVPSHAPDSYLHLLGSLAQILSQAERRDALLQAQSAKHMQELLLETV